jgi:Flp pilus assembly protein TadD
LFRLLIMNIKDGNKDWLAAMQTGQKWAASGNLQRAERKFRLATRLSPARMEGWANLGAILLQQGTHLEAVQVLQRARMLAPGSAVVHLNLAHAHYLAGQDIEALAACHEAIAISPTPDALNKLGVILRSSWRFAEAEGAFRDALARDGGHPHALVNLATLLMLRARFPEARQALAAAANRILPEDARKELRRASLLLAEWERIDPVIRAAFPAAGLDEVMHALGMTPSELLDPDPVVTLFLQAMNKVSEGIGQTSPRIWPVPDDWPWIEAHFSLHRGDTVESYLTARKGGESIHATGSNELSQYADAVRLRRNGIFNADLACRPDAALRYIHWLLLHGQDDAKYCPGHFKLQPNRVKGNSAEARAEPEHVVGTIRHFFLDLMPAVEAAEVRAISIYMMLSKVHCFIDGNGRVARFLINQELESKGCSPILFPGALNERWIGAQRKIYRTRDIRPLIEEIHEAQSFTEGFLSDLEDMRGGAMATAIDEGRL